MNIKDMMVAGAMGTAAVFVARKIPPVEKILDSGVKTTKNLGLPAVMTAPDGFPLVYALLPAVLAFGINKYL